MTLPSSGALDYNSIRAEFGAPSSNVYISLFNRTGAYVYNVPANSNIPTSNGAQVSVSNFYGAKSKGDYSAGPGGTHNTGGKNPITYWGTGGPSLPGMSDTSDSKGTSSAVYGSSNGSGQIWMTYTSGQGWSGTMTVYRNDNGTSPGSINITNNAFGSGGWSGTSWLLNGVGSNYSWLNTGQLNIYRPW